MTCHGQVGDGDQMLVLPCAKLSNAMPRARGSTARQKEHQGARRGDGWQRWPQIAEAGKAAACIVMLMRRKGRIADDKMHALCRHGRRAEHDARPRQHVLRDGLEHGGGCKHSGVLVALHTLEGEREQWQRLEECVQTVARVELSKGPQPLLRRHSVLAPSIQLVVAR